MHDAGFSLAYTFQQAESQSLLPEPLVWRLGAISLLELQGRTPLRSFINTLPGENRKAYGLIWSLKRFRVLHGREVPEVVWHSSSILLGTAVCRLGLNILLKFFSGFATTKARLPGKPWVRAACESSQRGSRNELGQRCRGEPRSKHLLKSCSDSPPSIDC